MSKSYKKRSQSLVTQIAGLRARGGTEIYDTQQAVSKFMVMLKIYSNSSPVENELLSLCIKPLKVEKAEAAAEIPCAFVHSQCQEVKQGSKEATLKSENY